MENNPQNSSMLEKILASLKGKSENIDPEAEHKKQVMERLKAMSEDNRQAKTDNTLNEYVNQPLANAGYPEAGAGLAAAGSTAAGMLPKDESEFAVGLPVNASASMLSKMRGMAAKAEEPVGNALMNAGARYSGDVAKSKANRAAVEAGADTLVYGKNGPKRYTAEELKKLRPQE